VPLSTNQYPAKNPLVNHTTTKVLQSDDVEAANLPLSVAMFAYSIVVIFVLQCFSLCSMLHGMMIKPSKESKARYPK
jgi:hypothetical protein